MADLRIEWTQSADDPSLSGNVVAYELARSGAPNPTAVVATIAATAAEGDTLYTETVQPGAHWYRVRAVDADGHRSLWSNEATILVVVATTINHRFVAILSPEPRIAALSGEPRMMPLPNERRTAEAGGP